MFCSLRPSTYSKRLFCSSSSTSSLQSRLSSNSPPTTGVLYSRKPIAKPGRSPIYGFSAPSTAGISPVDVAYSRFLNRHAPLEIANRLLKMADKSESKTDTWGESITWQSATGTEYEFQRIPHRALDSLRSKTAPTSTSSSLWEKSETTEHSEQDETEEILQSLLSGSESSMKLSAKVVVVPLGKRDISGRDFYENLMSAVQGSLGKLEEYEMTSTKRKRRLKMNKHKFKKRRKEQESARRKLGK